MGLFWKVYYCLNKKICEEKNENIELNDTAKVP